MSPSYMYVQYIVLKAKSQKTFCYFQLWVFVCVVHAHECQFLWRLEDRVSDLLELELQGAVSHRHGAESQTQDFSKNNKYS